MENQTVETPTRAWPSRARRMGLAGALTGLIALSAAASETGSAASIKVIARGLDNPRGLAIGPEGALYVVEAGRGGTGPCVDLGDGGGVRCFGLTGGVTRVLEGRQERIVTGLGSLARPEDGGSAFGPHDISFQGRGGGYVVVGLCSPASEAGACGKLIRLKPNGKWETAADLRGYDLSHNPDGVLSGSDPYGVLALPGQRIIVDAAANDLLRVAPDGHISLLAVFPKRLVDSPGGEIQIDAVPTSVAIGPDGAFYVGELTGYPFPVGGARIYRVVPGEAPQIYAEGFTNVIDIAFEADGSLLVLEITRHSLASGDPTGALIRLRPNGSRRTLLSAGLNTPTAVLVAGDGALYISNCGTCAGDGQVIRFKP